MESDLFYRVVVVVIKKKYVHSVNPFFLLLNRLAFLLFSYPSVLVI